MGQKPTQNAGAPAPKFGAARTVIGQGWAQLGIALPSQDLNPISLVTPAERLPHTPRVPASKRTCSCRGTLPSSISTRQRWLVPRLC